MHTIQLLIISLAVLPAATPTPAPPSTGEARILNKCPYPVYLWPVFATRHPYYPVKIEAKTGVWSEPYHSSEQDGGTSLKLSRTTELKNITQFQDAFVPETQMVWYSGSNQDCAVGSCPFKDEGVKIIPSERLCDVKYCGKGGSFCEDFEMKDRTSSCEITARLTMVLCSG